MSEEVNSLLDLLDGSDITRSHKTGEIAYFGDEGENVRVLGGIKREPDTEKQREFQMAKWIANSLLRDGCCYDFENESGNNDVMGTVVTEDKAKASTYESSPTAIVVCEDGKMTVNVFSGSPYSARNENVDTDS